jgi:uncharacterized protein
MHPTGRAQHNSGRRARPSYRSALSTYNVNHGLLLPILLHGRDDQGRPLLGPPRSGRETGDFLCNADIPVAVEALRQYWMPIRYARAR